MLSLSTNSAAVLLKERAMQEFSIAYGQEDGLEIRKLNMQVQHKDQKQKVQKLCLGNPTNNSTKVILLVGATGTGKTNLINSMVNYIYRVEFSDSFRFFLIDDKNTPKKSQAEGQTNLITAYVFNHIAGMPFNYNYILIDTPSFGDTRGIQRDKEMMKQLEMFLKQNYGINFVDVVGLVIPSSAARLTQTQCYVYEGLSSMFGKDIRDNIFVMATLADAETPPVLEALKEANIEYAGFYKFNNSALYVNNKGTKSTNEESDSDGIGELFWNMGYKNMNKFFKKLGKTSPASLTLTKEVLGERSRLETAIFGLQNHIQLGLGKLSNLNQERDMLARINDDMKGSENYEEEVEVPKITKIDLPKGTYTMVCLKCNDTCHYPCMCANDDADKINCAAMRNGQCTVCPDKCKWDIHKNMGFRFEHSWIKEKRIVQELLNCYNNAKRGKSSKEQVVKSIEDEINACSGNMVDMIQRAQKHVERLEEIALKPNPLSTKEYIDIMIESEKIQKRCNYEKCINLLEKSKNEVSILQGVRGKPKASCGEDLLKYFLNLMK